MKTIGLAELDLTRQVQRKVTIHVGRIPEGRVWVWWPSKTGMAEGFHVPPEEAVNIATELLKAAQALREENDR